MVLVAVDDLLFKSKIRATAKQAGVELAFAVSQEEVLEQARNARPALVIFDLNSGKADPVSTIAALKADPALSTIPTLGFASHVHAELIAEARKAGADEVLARSAFAGNLAEILLSAERSA
ncbi:MAG: response regulator [Vicinamibacterales bacterium]